MGITAAPFEDILKSFNAGPPGVETPKPPETTSASTKPPNQFGSVLDSFSHPASSETGQPLSPPGTFKTEPRPVAQPSLAIPPSPFSDVLSSFGTSPQKIEDPKKDYRFSEDEPWYSRAIEYMQKPLFDLHRKNAGPIESGLEDVLTGLTSPENLALTIGTLALGPGLGLGLKALGVAEEAIPVAIRGIRALVDGGFTISQINGLAHEVPQFLDALKFGDYDYAKRLAGQMLLTGPMAALGTYGTVHEAGTFLQRTGFLKPIEHLNTVRALAGAWKNRDVQIEQEYNDSLRAARAKYKTVDPIGVGAVTRARESAGDENLLRFRHEALAADLTPEQIGELQKSISVQELQPGRELLRPESWPSEEELPWAAIREHELGHVLVGAELGLHPVEVISHNHPSNIGGPAIAIANFDWEKVGLVSKDGFIKNKGLIENPDLVIGKMLPMYMAGREAERINSKVNPVLTLMGARGDYRVATKLLDVLQDGLGIRLDIPKIMENSVAKAREILTKPGNLDKIRMFATEREDNIPDTHQISAEKIQAFINAVKQGEKWNPEQEPMLKSLLEKQPSALEKPAVSEAPETPSQLRLGPWQTLPPKNELELLRSLEKQGISKTNEPILVRRFDEPGVTPDINKPQGLYTRPNEIKAPETAEGMTGSMWEWHPQKPLDVSNKLVLTHSRFGRGGTGEVSAGIKALQKLVTPEQFDKLITESKNQLLPQFEKEFPNVDWKRYFDSYEMLEGYAGLKAREAGYDALIDKSPHAPDFAEYVALKPSALTPSKILTPSQINQAADLVARSHSEQGGATYNLRTGEVKTGFSVGAHPERTLELDHAPSPEELRSYIETNRDLLSRPDRSLGTWAAPDGRHVLDVVATVPTEAEAMRIATEGRAKPEESIYDLANKKEIPVPPQLATARILPETTPNGWDEVSKYLRPEEIEGIRDELKQRAVDTFNEMNTKEFQAAALAGSVQKGWYTRSAKLFQSMFGKDSDRFVKILAALSPVKPVPRNMIDALNFYSDWVKAGRPVKGAKLTSLLRGQMPSYARNLVRAVNGEDLSGPKVSNFYTNLLGQLNSVTKDRMMAYFVGKKLTFFSNKANRLAFDAATRATAKDLGWKPAEVQESIWSFVRSVVDLMTERGINAEEATRILSNEDIRARASDFADLILTHTGVRSALDHFATKIGDERFRPSNLERSPIVRRLTRAREAVKGGVGKAPSDLLQQIATRAYTASREEPIPEVFQRSFGRELQPPRLIPGLSPIGQRLVKLFGTTDDPREAKFVLPNGIMVPTEIEHTDIINRLQGGTRNVDIRPDFINQEKIVRTRFRTSRFGDEIVYTTPKSGLTPEQIQNIQRGMGMMSRAGRVTLEVADENGPHVSIDFPRPSDIHTVLEKLYGKQIPVTELQPRFAVPEKPTPSKEVYEAKTDEPFIATLFRGSGKPREQIYRSAKMPILGEGRYTTPDEKFAAFFGPKIDKVNVRLEKPLVIRNDAQWRALTKKAGWEFPNPTRYSPEGQVKTIEEINRLRSMLEQEGYDGLIALPNHPDNSFSDNARTLGKVFGQDTVVEFNKQPIETLQPRFAMPEKPIDQPTTELKPSRVRDTYNDKERAILLAKYERGAKLSDLEKEMLREGSQIDDENFKLAHENGVIKSYVNNHVTHVWQDRDNDAVNELKFQNNSGAFSTNVNSARKRVFQTLFHGEMLGGKPANDNLMELALWQRKLIKQAINNRKLLEDIRDSGARMPDGSPVVAMTGTGRILGNEGENQAAVLFPNRLRRLTISQDMVKDLKDTGELDRMLTSGRIKQVGFRLDKEGNKIPQYQWEAGDYIYPNHHAFRDWVYAQEAPDGTPIFMNGEMRLHPEAADYIKNTLGIGESPIRDFRIGTVPVGRKILGASTEAKHILLGLSPFHATQMHLRAIMLGMMPKFHNFEGAITQLVQDPVVQKGIQNGLEPMIEHQGLEGFTEGVGGRSKLIDKLPGLRQLQTGIQEYTFHRLIPYYKMMAFKSVVEQFRNRGSLNPFKDAANYVNNAFGGQNWAELGVSLSGRDLLRVTTLAPDWLISEIRFLKTAIEPGAGGQIARKDLARIVLYTYAAARVMNMLTTGKPHAEAPFGLVIPGGKGEDDKVYAFRTLPTDLLHAVSDPHQFLMGRVNPMYVRTGIEAATGRDQYGRKVTPIGELGDLAKNLAPIPTQAFLRKNLFDQVTDISNPEQIAKALGASTYSYRTEAEKLSQERASDRTETGPVDPQKLAIHLRDIHLEDALRRGEISQGAIRRAFPKRTADEIIKRAMLTPLQARFDRLPLNDALDVWNIATPTEKKEISHMLWKKRYNWFRSHQNIVERRLDPVYKKLQQVYPDLH